MCPTAKIARAIVGDPPESSSTFRLTSAAESKYTHHSAAASSITAMIGPTSSPTGAWPASTITSPSRMIRNSPKRSAKWCGSSRSAGSSGASDSPVVRAADVARRVAVLAQHHARLAADGDRPQDVAEGPRHRGRDREQRRGGHARARDPVAQHVPGLAGAAGVGHREHHPRGGERQREHRAVAVRGRLDRHRRDPGGHAAGQEQQPQRGGVGAVAVVEHREPDPGPPQREEQPEGDPHAAHLRLADDQVGEPADGEHEHEVQVQLDPGDPLSPVVHDGGSSRTRYPRCSPKKDETRFS